MLFRLLQFLSIFDSSENYNHYYNQIENIVVENATKDCDSRDDVWNF